MKVRGTTILLATRGMAILSVGIAKTQNLLGWAPPISVDMGLKKAAKWYAREASV